MRAYPLCNGTHEYLLKKFWSVWTGEFLLGPTLDEQLGDLGYEIHYEIDLMDLTIAERDAIYDAILAECKKRSSAYVE